MSLTECVGLVNLVDCLDHIHGKMRKLLEQYKWNSLQKKLLVHTITFNIIVFNQQKKVGAALVITIPSFKIFEPKSKAGLCPLWQTGKKAMWRIWCNLLSIQNEVISLVAMCSKELWLV